MASKLEVKCNGCGTTVTREAIRTQKHVKDCAGGGVVTQCLFASSYEAEDVPLFARVKAQHQKICETLFPTLSVPPWHVFLGEWDQKIACCAATGADVVSHECKGLATFKNLIALKKVLQLNTATRGRKRKQTSVAQEAWGMPLFSEKKRLIFDGEESHTTLQLPDKLSATHVIVKNPDDINDALKMPLLSSLHISFHVTRSTERALAKWVSENGRLETLFYHYSPFDPEQVLVDSKLASNVVLQIVEGSVGRTTCNVSGLFADVRQPGYHSLSLTSIPFGPESGRIKVRGFDVLQSGMVGFLLTGLSVHCVDIDFSKAHIRRLSPSNALSPRVRTPANLVVLNCPGDALKHYDNNSEPSRALTVSVSSLVDEDDWDKLWSWKKITHVGLSYDENDEVFFKDFVASYEDFEANEDVTKPVCSGLEHVAFHIVTSVTETDTWTKLLKPFSNAQHVLFVFTSCQTEINVVIDLSNYQELLSVYIVKVSEECCSDVQVQVGQRNRGVHIYTKTNASISEWSFHAGFFQDNMYW